MLSRKERIAWKKAFVKVEKILSKKKYECLYDGCSETAIKSHSQQKNGPLRAICENGKVYRLNDDLQNSYSVESDEIKNDFVLKGIGESSVFPGFCHEHEKIFSVFEDTDLVVGNKNQACSLFYRTFSYEKARKRREYERWSLLLDELYDVIGNSRKGRQQIDAFKKHIEVTCNYNISRAHEMLQQDDFNELNVIWYKFESNLNVSCSSTINLQLDDYIPYVLQNPSSPVPTFTFNIIPSVTCTHIIISWLLEFDEFAKWLIDVSEDKNVMEILINRFCFCDSEDACINPSLWDSVLNKPLFIHNMSHVVQRGHLSISDVPSLIKLKK